LSFDRCSAVGKYIEAFKNMKRVLTSAQTQRPSTDEYLNVLKLTLLGLTVTGLLAYGVGLLMWLAQQGTGLTPTG